MKIYVDSNFHCYESNPDGNLREVETDFFVGKCTTFIEGCCYDDSKGYVAIYPWKPSDKLEEAQYAYEFEKLADAENALAILLGGESE